jgi:hypothetical protein
MGLQEVGVRTGSDWLRIGAGGRHLWMRYWTFRFHKMCRISWLAENRLASQEGLGSMEWVSEFLLNNVTTKTTQLNNCSALALLLPLAIIVDTVHLIYNFCGKYIHEFPSIILWDSNVAFCLTSDC